MLSLLWLFCPNLCYAITMFSAQLFVDNPLSHQSSGPIFSVRFYGFYVVHVASISSLHMMYKFVCYTRHNARCPNISCYMYTRFTFAILGITVYTERGITIRVNTRRIAIMDIIWNLRLVVYPEQMIDKPVHKSLVLVHASSLPSPSIFAPHQGQYGVSNSSDCMLYLQFEHSSVSTNGDTPCHLACTTGTASTA